MNMQNQRTSGLGADLQQTPTAQSTDATLTRLDREMNEILSSNAYKDEREKWNAYFTVLQRYLHFVDNDRAQEYQALAQEKTTESGAQQCLHPRDEKEKHYRKLNDSVIIESIPAKFRAKAKLLLRRLHDAPSTEFSWNSAGVVAIGGKLIKDSNIVDLVNDAMRARKAAKPAGRRLFAKYLRAVQTPREFVGNDDLWLESRANSTLQETENAGHSRGSSSSSGDSGEISHISPTEFYSGSESGNTEGRHTQMGSGGCTKKRRVTWINLKL